MFPKVFKTKLEQYINKTKKISANTENWNFKPVLLETILDIINNKFLYILIFIIRRMLKNEHLFIGIFTCQKTG